MRNGTIAGWVLAAAMAVVAVQGMSQQDAGPILLPKKPVATASVLVICDLACNWKLDGEAKGRIEAGGSTKVKVELGQHIVAAATLDGLDKVENEIAVKAAGQTIAHIALKPVREARLKAGQEAREKPKPASGPTLLVLCDLACNWKLDGVAKGRIEAGASAKANVELGQHLVIAATEDGADQVKQLAKAEEKGQTVVSIELQPVRDARLKAEQQAKDKADQEARDKTAQEAQAKAAQEARDNAAREQKEREQKERERLAREEAAGVWTDPATGLMWTKKDNGSTVEWQGATAYCQNLRLAGYSDWRLPTIDELQGIYDPYANVHGNHVKGNLQLSNRWEWSSSPGKTSREGWFFIFANGGRTSNVLGFGYGRRALCVRRSGE